MSTLHILGNLWQEATESHPSQRSPVCGAGAGKAISSAQSSSQKDLHFSLPKYPTLA